MTTGISKRRFYALRDAGAVERIARGLYRRTDVEDLSDPDLVEIARRASRATVCLTSALVYHNLTDANPASIDIALPAGARRPRIATPITWHWFDRRRFGIGRETMVVDQQTQIGIYDARRCIIDAFRLRHREGEDLAYIALRRWLRQRGNTPAALYEMTRHFPTTTKIVRTALEIILYE